ncbi:MAG: (2Fe-2S)-binding protein [Deltaproteobacteria bacterium]|nr:(2Fe-2S)-binding protein [Deltaproteobacteria bacterium]
MSADREDRPCPHHSGLTRRRFLATVGTGTAAAALGANLGAPVPAGASAEITSDDMTPLSLRVNGRTHRLLVEPRWSLLYVLREQLGLTGAKPGCERGECGACTVLIDGEPRYSCLTLALEAEGREVTTVEGLMAGEELGPTQRAFVETDAFQCGYCTPGQIVAAEGLLRANPDPTPAEVARGMSGNLCRCGAYTHIFQAVRRAAELKRG